MKKLNKFNLIFALLLLTFSFEIAKAQDQTDSDSSERPPVQEPVRRDGLLRELGLNQDQIRQIRMLNARRRPLMQEAQRRLRAANRELDQAIYAETVDESQIQINLKEVQLAQAEVIKIKAINELEVRKILTPEQLNKFKQLREQIINRLNDRPGNRDQNPGRRQPTDKMPKNPDNSRQNN